MRAQQIYDQLPTISSNVCDVTGVDLVEWGPDIHEPPEKTSQTAALVRVGRDFIVAGVSDAEQGRISRLLKNVTKDAGYLMTYEARYHLDKAIATMQRFAQSDLSLLGGCPRARRNIGAMYGQLSQVAVDASLCAGPTYINEDDDLAFDARTEAEALAAHSESYRALLPVMSRPQRIRVAAGLERLQL